MYLGVLICLLGAARCSSDKKMCPCPEISSRNDTQPPAKNCYQISETFRYTCKDPNLRKAGTSNFIKCKQDGNGSPHWSPLNISLKCIPDPNRTIQQPPSSTVTTDPNTTTTQPLESTVTTAAPSSPQMAQSLSPSASVSAEPDKAEATSPLQALSGRSQGTEENVRETEATHQTTATLTGVRTGIGFASAAIVCALIGISFFCYKRRSKSAIPQEMPEEQFPMNNVQSEH
ncbi:dual specificity protein kinase shkD-like isoform X5 [Cyclopterus lumpus]|uniref:dual specificity protein kinase shkD-like isoform X5 n=1 Tax=Cyclopterus lumpus TaxID=8103 RepID=UPI001486E2B9|nr:dual specificity protein kinase shkD-like isoform X5 [Cyclopterus lumpus]